MSDVGFVPAENLIGRAEFLFFSTDGTAGWLEPWNWFGAIRYDRLFQAVR
jgi:signal peptidase I